MEFNLTKMSPKDLQALLEADIDDIRAAWNQQKQTPKAAVTIEMVMQGQ